MQMKVDTSHVLMSDVLKGQVPELEVEEQVTAVTGKHVLFLARKVVGTTSSAIVGILRGILFSANPEVEFRIDLKEALDIIEAKDIKFADFMLRHDEHDIKIFSPGQAYVVEAARIDEISVSDQLCTLGLHLKKQAR